MPGPRWDPDEGRWVFDDEPSPAPRHGRRRSVDVAGRPDGDAGASLRHLSPEDLASGILFPAHREYADRMDGAPSSSGVVPARHGADGPAPPRGDREPRRGRRRAPEDPGPGTTPPVPYPGSRRPADTPPSVHDRTGPAHRGRRRAGDDLRPDTTWSDRATAEHVWPDPVAARSVPDDVGYPGDDPGGRAGERPDRVPTGGRPPGSGIPDDTDGHRPVPGPRHGAAGPDDLRPARRRRWPWLVGAVVAAAAAVSVGLLVVGGPDDGNPVSERPLADSRPATTVPSGTPTGDDRPDTAPPGDAAAPPAPAQVTYEVSGSGSVGAITFGAGSSVAQIAGAELPWERTSPAAAEPTEYSVDATGGSGEVSCRIVVDGAVVAEETADGDHPAVACSGRR